MTPHLLIFLLLSIMRRAQNHKAKSQKKMTLYEVVAAAGLSTAPPSFKPCNRHQAIRTYSRSRTASRSRLSSMSRSVLRSLSAGRWWRC